MTLPPFKVESFYLPSQEGPLERCVVVSVPDEIMESSSLDSVINMVVAVREADRAQQTSTLVFTGMGYDFSKFKTFEEMVEAFSHLEG